MRPTLLQHVGAWISLLPVLVAPFRFDNITPARAWVIAWCLVMAALDAAGLVLGMRGINNLWIGYLSQPIVVGIALWALAHWQPDSTSRAALRFSIPLIIAVNVILILTIEDRRTFSLVASPFHYIVVLLAAMITFVRQSLGSEESLFQQDWFWITGGMMLFAAAATAVGPLAWYFLGPRVDLLHAMFNVRAAANVFAFAAITWGMLCPRPQRFSGGSLSPQS